MPRIQISDLQDFIDEEQGDLDAKQALRIEKKDKKPIPPPKFNDLE